ncbi:hypothetical protein [Chryseosolibacter indicus]|uniref:Uncharacterized protein n=1 Tax=Chryseosolibacter indicus TaxID=2782351 RepID=A0ABS5VMS4_9BACT|nr:hypothetical protein [Chryseosolibacter indicus]MBT1702140.1 hypothetical protein [Chryseosolibacter indicus]
MKTLLLVLLALPLGFSAYGQKQLVLLRKQDVILRLYPGDEIVFRVKGSKIKRTSYVNNLSDTSVVTHRDTIPFHRIEKLYFKQTRRYNIIGGALVFGGAALFLIDQLNYTVIQGNDASIDSGVSAASLSAIAVGLPMLLIRKKSQKINYKYRLRMVQKGSIFYQPDTRGYISPYIDN